MNKKLSRTEMLNNDLCVEQSGGNRFNLVLIAAIRSREISQRNRSSQLHEHLHTPVTALLEIQEGKIGEEYLLKLRK